MLEKCLRLAYYDKLQQLLPEEYEKILPPKPAVVGVFEDEEHPAFAQAQTFRAMIQERKDLAEQLFELRVDRLASDEEATFDPEKVAVFTAVLLNISSKTFSHTFTAFTKLAFQRARSSKCKSPNMISGI